MRTLSIPPSTQVPLAAPVITDEDRAAVLDVLGTPRLAYGHYANEVEALLPVMAATPGHRALATSSGTAALHLALLCCGVGQGSDVIVPALTFIAPANAVAYTGGRPVFADVSLQDRQMDVDRLRRYIKREYKPSADGLRRADGNILKAILTVDLLGHPSDVPALRILADELGIRLIDDAAESLGATINGMPVGAHSDLVVLSFNINKTFTGAGGGALLARCPGDFQQARHLATLAKTDPVLYDHDQVAFDYRMREINAALVTSQLSRFAPLLAAKRAVARHYHERLHDIPTVGLPTETPGCRASWWFYAITVPADARDHVMSDIEPQAETRPLFSALTRVAAFDGYPADRCPNAEHLAATGICLPSSVNLTEDEVDRVCDALIDSLARYT